VDRYSGDPRLVLTEGGATLDYQGGQPVMDRGLENCALLSLFADDDWQGNIFLEKPERIGSDFEKTCRGTITLSRLADAKNSAERALSTTRAFGEVVATVTNPETDHIAAVVKLGAGGSLSLIREKALWTAQINDPASRRLSE
jgi:hypothetical protein